MTRRQKIAVAALPVLATTMLGVYQLAAWRLGPRLGWFAGFPVFWVLWCLPLSWFLLGRRGLTKLFARCTMGRLEWALVGLPPLLVSALTLVRPDERAAGLELAALVTLAIVNSTLEEVLWRGVYATLFPASVVWGYLWPTFWFALWHAAPGSVAPVPVWQLVAGAALFGAALGWVAWRTGSIRWTVVSHVLAGLASVLA